MKFEDLWRPIETDDPDKMGFYCGRAKGWVWLGLLNLVISIWILGLMFSSTSTFLSWIRDAAKSKEYETAVSVYAIMGVAGLQFFESVVIALWLLVGRTEFFLNKKERLVVRNFRLRMFCFYSKKFSTGATSAFHFRRKRRFFAPIHVLSLSDNEGKQRFVLSVSRAFAYDGWKMAERMAKFLEIPLVAADAK